MSIERFEFPLSFAQQRLWFLDQLEGPSSVYTIRLPIRLSGRLDADALQFAVNALVERHESLRTTFMARDGRPVQVINPCVDVQVQWHDAPAGTRPDDNAFAHQWVGQCATDPFALEQGPLLRAHVLRIDTDEHLLLLLCHHIVADAWSTSVLFRDLASAYAARVNGETLQWPELPVQYADFTVWQRDWLAGQELQRQLNFWRAALTGAPAETALPFDRPRPLRQTYRGQRLHRVLSVELTEALKQLAGDHSSTLFMILFTAFNILLSRYSGQEDLCVGTPIAGRRRTELEGLIGLFANTLVLRTDLSGQPNFVELLSRVRQACLAAFAHQEMPFEKLVEELQPVRDQSRSPLFQTMFILQNAPWEAQPIRGLEVMPGETGPTTTAKFDLTVSASEFERQLWINFEYNTDLFDERTIAQFAVSFATLLTDIVAEPERAMHEYALVPTTAEGLHSILTGPELLLDDAATVHGLVEAQASRSADAVAIEYGAQSWTYQQLINRSQALADCLEELLPRVNSPTIALCTERSPAMLAGLLGVLQAGAAYLPLDPGYPGRRLRHMLEDSGAGILITQADIVASLADFDGAIVLLTAAGRIAEIRMPRRQTQAQNSWPIAAAGAYLIYTSGSTGLPKGVAVSHRAAVNFLLSMAAEPGLTPQDRLLAVTTLSFDIALLELLLPLTVGATVVIAPAAACTDGQALHALLDSSAATVMQATPATWRMLLNAGWTGNQQVRILCGGEALDAGLAAQLLACGSELWNLYGPTETTVWSACERITDVQPGQSMSIGRPIANTTIKIVAAGLQPVPTGAVGELAIGGAGLATGYHARDQLTREKFIHDPLVPGQRWYKTGDRARVRADGTLELLGRMDRQVKLRGFRIELGEIEAALNALGAVSSAAVILQDARLIAYVVPATAWFDPLGLRTELRAALPEYMLPAAFVELAALPLTPNGKIDRRRLPAPDSAVVAGQFTAPLAPEGPLEAALAALFAEVLQQTEVGANGNFFDLGGHSLLATQLVARLRDVLGLAVPLRDIFDEPTVAGLARRLASPAAQRSALQFTASAGQLGPREPRWQRSAPASLMQQRLWFLDQLEPGNSTYNLAWCLHLTGELNRPALVTALQTLVARHEILRTTFSHVGGEPQQIIADELHLEIEFDSLPDSAAGALQQKLSALASRPFALDTGPLLRLHVIATAPAQQTLLVVIHHIIADGWSLAVLFDELARAYNALCHGAAPALPLLPVQYADYSVWQRDQQHAGKQRADIDYWRTQLDSAPPLLELPTDRPRPAVQSHRGARLSASLSPAITQSVSRLAREQDCTPFMLLVATFALVLGRYAGTRDVVIGTPIAGRHRTELEGLIGFFVNTLVLRTRFADNPTFRTLLARVRHTLLEAYEHQDVPFEKLVDVLRPPRDTGRTPIFQVMFNLHNEPQRAVEFDGLSAQPVGIERGMAKFDLTVSMGQFADDSAGEALYMHFEYNSDLFAEQTMREMADYFTLLLQALTEKPECRVSALPDLTAGEAATVGPDAHSDDQSDDLDDWQGSIVARFNRQVAKAPTGTAVQVDERTLNYRAVNDQANAMAERLLGLALPGDAAVPRVGLLCATDTPIVVGLLGILKAGCAWVPLDPNWPDERLATIADDARLSAVVTDAAHVARAGALELSPDSVLQLDGAVAADPDVTLEADALACIIYTSGSTGVPKGVMQTHQGILTQVQRYSAALAITSKDRLSGLSGYAYDAAIQDIFGALLNGAAVCLFDVRGAGIAEDTRLVTALGESGVTIFHAAPSLYRYLFGGDLNCSHDLSAVRRVVLGGEAARRADFELFRARFAPTARFVNGLGLTESTLALQFHADADTRFLGQSVPVGAAVPGLSVELLDEQGESGWYGEIVLSGPGLSPGYWRRPELTAERLGPGSVLRTGDIGRRLPDGTIVFVGRSDEQINIRGYRVEPGEIEAALCALTGIDESAVGLVNRAGEPWLVAWCAGAVGQRPDAEALRYLLSERLPGYMLPQFVDWVEKLPRRPNGKLDRDALPIPQFERTASDISMPPRDDLEALLVSVWCDILGREDLGVHDDFFALGGHSLLATRVIARIRDQLGIEVPLILLFEQPTIAGFAAALSAPEPPQTNATQFLVTH